MKSLICLVNHSNKMFIMPICSLFYQYDRYLTAANLAMIHVIQSEGVSMGNNTMHTTNYSNVQRSR